ncbi:hypothetical protein MNBD_GAMMA07-1391 [hydrothermal vent metagenome]|uniref:HTH tetR-type domain-containing protein n=1 Tax=hydrothermal vent metagenome TaxID=652676 RepID=A0A3B0WNS5_9ZZZZ
MTLETTQITEPPMTRKQKELFAREQLILDTAQDIMHHQGMQSLTMERIAAEIEYSKGTIYSHFSSKEEIISAISCRCMDQIFEMFIRARDYPGNHRERIAAIGLAHSIYSQLHPDEMQNMQLIKSSAIREKISAEKQFNLFQKEQKITEVVMQIVRDAMHDGDIPKDQPFMPDSIVLGLWTMGYGSSLLNMSGIPFEKLGMQQPLDMMLINSHKLLDSYQWKPLSSEFDIHALREKLCDALFAKEIKQLNSETP